MSTTLTRTDNVMNESIAWLDLLGYTVTPLTQYELLQEMYYNVLIYQPENVLRQTSIVLAMERVETHLT